MSNFSDNASSVVEQILNYGQVLRSERVISYLDFVEQLTYILFLKLDYENTQPPLKKKTSIPRNLNWKTLISKEGNDLELHYTTILNELSKHKGTVGTIFRQSRNNIREPAKLRRLINLIDKVVWIGETNSLMELYNNALNYCIDEIEDNLGQYFPPTPLIETIVKVIKPEPKKTICDPSCGIGEHLITAYNFITENYQLDKEEKSFLKFEGFKGQINHDVIAKLCAMNLFLHGIGGDKNPIVVEDALVSNPSNKFDFVFVNPAFGKKKKLMTNESKQKKEELGYERDDFIRTSSIHLNFLQHVKSLLKINGEAAIFVPDNVLFEGGTGATIRKKLLNDCDVHTLLRLPTGIYRTTGVKANVLFFDKKPASEKHWTDKLWIYDLRTNMHFTEKTDTLQTEDLKDFIKCYNPDNRWDRKNTKRFKSFSYDELLKRDKVSLDIFWLKDESLEDSENLPNPKIIAKEIRKNLESATKLFAEIEKNLPS